MPLEAGLDITWRTFAVLAAVLATISLYTTERAPLEAVSVGVITVAMVFFHVFPVEGFAATDVLAGFANPALIGIMALLVIGQGLFQTAALEPPTRVMLRAAETRPRMTLLTVFACAFVVSAFLNNTPVVVLFIPIAAALAGRVNSPASTVLMPLSFVSVLAGATTLIGSSTNLLVADVELQLTGEALGFFSPAPMGLTLAAAGLLYLLVIAPRFAPKRGPAVAPKDAEGRQFIAQIEVTPDHPLIGASAVAGLFRELPDMTVRMVQRDRQSFLPPFDGVALRTGDVVIVSTTKAVLTQLISNNPGFREGFSGAGRFAAGDRADLALVEAVVAPASRLIGRTVAQSGFQSLTGCWVLAVQRRSRMIRARLSEVRLEAGDVLLVLGPGEALKELRAQRDVLPLEWSTTDLPNSDKAVRARWIFLAVIGLAATQVLPIVHAAMLGALAMVAGGCLNVRQAARAFDLRIFLLVGAAFALSGSMQATGAAHLLAVLAVEAASPFGVTAMLSSLFLVTAVLTNVLSNSATAVLFTPIAIAVAQQTGQDPRIFALTILFAANCSFATPIAYQTNLLVMGPGHYRFSDFIRLGAPLVFVLWVVFTIAAPWIFDL